MLFTFLPDATGQHPYGLYQEPGGEKKREEGGTHAKTMEGTGPTDLVADSGDEVRGWCPLLPLPGSPVAVSAESHFPQTPSRVLTVETRQSWVEEGSFDSS